MLKTQVEKESKSAGLEKKDAMNRARWRVGVGEIASKVGYIRQPPFTIIADTSSNLNTMETTDKQWFQ